MLAIGDLAAIVGLLGEMFVEHGLRVKKESPFKYTFICEFANDYIGYVSTVKAFREEGDLTPSGSYETTIGPNILIPEAGDMMVETALKTMNGLYNSLENNSDKTYVGYGICLF